MRAPYWSADRVEQRTQALGDGMALLTALLGGQQVHLDVGLVGLAAHVVVAHQAVEVIGAGGAGVALVVEHIRLPRQLAAQRLGHAQRLFKRRAVGHVHDDLQFALVVEGQHLYAHPSQWNQRHGDQQKHGHADEKQQAVPR